ncbi:hypothetical protein JG645_18130 [Vibrio cholerae]|nr:hypothetical protein [Vibrio cholerae]
MDAHDSWLTDEINKAYEKMLLGKTEFYSSDSAEQIMALRKKRVKAKQLISN